MPVGQHAPHVARQQPAERAAVLGLVGVGERLGDGAHLALGERAGLRGGDLALVAASMSRATVMMPASGRASAARSAGRRGGAAPALAARAAGGAARRAAGRGVADGARAGAGRGARGGGAVRGGRADHSRAAASVGRAAARAAAALGRGGAIEVGAVTSLAGMPPGAAEPIATVRSVSVTGSPRAAASAARPRSPADG